MTLVVSTPSMMKLFSAEVEPYTVSAVERPCRSARSGETPGFDLTMSV